MKNRLIYAIGTTASKAIGELKSISLSDFNEETIYRSWDTDDGTKSRNLGLNDSEVVNFPEYNLLDRVQTIVQEKDVNPSQRNVYDQLNTFFPIDNEYEVSKLPKLAGKGAGKNPMASRIIGVLNSGEIKTIVSKDVLDISQANANEAYLLMSPCGGTSTGLSVEIIKELAENNVKINLFFITPNYFVNIDKNSPDFYSKTVASFLRTIYDCKTQSHSIAGKTPLDLKPFIIESRWTQHRFAEYNPTDEDRIDEEAFMKYIAYALFAFLYQMERPQNFFANEVNHIGMSEPDKFLNMLLIYPNNQTKTKVVKEIQKIFNDNATITSGNNSDNQTVSQDKIESLLKKVIGGEDIILTYYITNKPELVKSQIKKWKDDRLFSSVSELKEILELVIKIIAENQNIISKVKPATENDQDKFNKSFQRNSTNFFQNIWDWIIGANGEDKVEDKDNLPLTNIDPKAIYDLDDWCDKLLTNYKSNKDILNKEARKANIFNDYHVVEGEVIISDDMKLSLKKNLFEIFNKGKIAIENIINDILDTYERNEIYELFQQPYPLSLWNSSSYEKARKKEGNVIIEGLNYHYKIIADIPPESLTYLRDDAYIKRYLGDKKGEGWCYPDKRLENLDRNNNLSRHFHEWHENIIRRLNPDGIVIENEFQKEQMRRVRLGAISILGKYMIIKDTDYSPIFTLNFDTHENQYFINYNYKGHNIESEKDMDFDNIVDSLISKLSKDAPNHNFNLIHANYINVDNLLDTDEKTFLNYSSDSIIQDALNKMETFLKDYLDSYKSTGVGNKENIDFIKEVTYYIIGLVNKYKFNHPTKFSTFPDLK